MNVNNNDADSGASLSNGELGVSDDEIEAINRKWNCGGNGHFDWAREIEAAVQRKADAKIERLRSTLGRIVNKRADGTVVISRDSIAFQAAEEYLTPNA